MATPLPTIQVSDAQLAVLLEVFGDAASYQAWLVDTIINKVEQHKQAEVQVVYRQRLNELNVQEQQAMTDIDAALASLVKP
jgi:hypothetical protein